MSEQKPGWRELPLGAVPYKSSTEYETGDWGVEKPEIDRSKLLQLHALPLLLPREDYNCAG
jgi:pyruvate ferredoxin oxidoreductase delta subunit